MTAKDNGERTHDNEQSFLCLLCPSYPPQAEKVEALAYI